MPKELVMDYVTKNLDKVELEKLRQFSDAVRREVADRRDRRTVPYRDYERVVAALKLARSMFLDLERGIAPSRKDFCKIEVVLDDLAR